MTNFLKSALIGFVAFLAVSTVQADWYSSVEIVTVPDGTRAVFATGIDGKRVRVGAIETLKKGTLLYHWGKGTPEQAARWDAEGKISPELVERLKAEKAGFIGSGFYVSTNPVDSANYGNVLVVIELPKDIEIIRADLRAPGGRGAEWNEIYVKTQVSGGTHTLNHTWINLRDANDLTKEFVMTPAKIEKLKPHGSYTKEELKAFLSLHPEYADTKWYQRELALAEKMEKIVHTSDKKILTALRRVLKKGSRYYDGLTIRGMMSVEGPLPADILRMYMEKNENYEYYDKLKEIDKPLALEIALTSRTEKAQWFGNNLLDSLPPTEQLPYLEKAAQYWGKDVPYIIELKISELKKQGLWNPAPLCERAFAP